MESKSFFNGYNMKLKREQIQAALNQAGHDMNKATAILSGRFLLAHADVRNQIFEYIQVKK